VELWINKNCEFMDKLNSGFMFYLFVDLCFIYLWIYVLFISGFNDDLMLILI